MICPLFMSPTATLRRAAIQAVLTRLASAVVSHKFCDAGSCSIHIFPALPRISILLLLFSLLVHVRFFSTTGFMLLFSINLLLKVLEVILAKF